MISDFEKLYEIEYKNLIRHYNFDPRFPEKGPISEFPIMKMIRTISQLTEKVNDGRIVPSNSPMTPSDLELFRIEKLKKINGVLKEQQKNINVCDLGGDTCLHGAAHMSNIDEDAFEELLKYGADISKRNAKAETPLHKAAKNACRSDIMRTLLRYGGDPNSQNNRKETPMHLASFHLTSCISTQCDHSNTIKELLKNGARLDINNCRLQNVLHSYLYDRKCRLDIVQRYLEKNSTMVNSQDYMMFTPLHYAIMNSVDINIIKELLNKGADANARDYENKTPLHYLPIHGYSEEVYFKIIKALLDKGADINATDIHNFTPLCFVVLQKGYRLAKIFILLGAKDTGVRKTLYNFKPILGEVVCNLRQLSNTLPVEASSCNATCSCDASCCRELLELIKLILESGVDPDTGNCGQQELECKDLKIPVVDKLLVQYRVLKNCKILLNEGTSDKDILFKIKAITPLHLNVSHKRFKRNWIGFRDACISEILMMRKDTLSENFTMYEFVSERCSVLNASKVPNVVFDKLLFKISNNCYPHCKDILFAAIKSDDVQNQLLKLKISVYKTDTEKVTLDYDFVYNLARYLTKVDLINLILAFNTQ